MVLNEYDAGLLNDFGGGNVEWWQDYMRAELARAYECYQFQIQSGWQPIEAAPKDNKAPILVNDVNGAWAAAKWLECDGFAGWIYEDEILQDVYPLGPQPAHWFDVPPVPCA